MNKIVFTLLLYIQIQYKIICFLLVLLLGKNFKPKSEQPVRKIYQKLQVDPMHIIETLEKLDYKQLLIEYELKHGKPLKPIKRRKNSKSKLYFRPFRTRS